MSDESLQRIAEVEEARHGTAEQGIKPGDVVRFTSTWLNDSVVGVAAVVQGDDHWTTFVFTEVRYGVVLLGIIESKAHHLTRLGTADADALRAATLYVAARGNGFDPDPQRQAARAEALRRGWRELDAEDLTEEPWDIRVVVAGESDGIGRLMANRNADGVLSWGFYHFGGDEAAGFFHGAYPARWTKAEAVRELLTLENARRAKERA